METDPDELADLLWEATDEALQLDDRAEAELRLTRLADLCAQVPGPRMADALLAILNHDSPAVRREAGEALLDVAYQRFKEVAHAVERLLSRAPSGPALQELPFILTEIHDPDPVPLLVRFLGCPDAEVVAAAIEALAAYGDPAAIRHLEPLLDDAREAPLEDMDEAPAPLRELAAAAIDELSTGGSAS